ncbi:hypothetical protein HYW44_02490 [Candidatus Daviesbacteria bacterium]|nr:hypothetical protein [Candidatus Daviesbacteria bacterium]
MQILPLRFIHDFDKKTIGVNLFNLAKLNHFGLPVVESVIVLPPTDLIKKIIDKYSSHKTISDNMGNLKLELFKLKMPEAFDVHLNSSQSKHKVVVNLEKLWRDLLQKWYSELVSKIERQEKIFLNLTPQQVIFSSNFSSFGAAFFDEDKGHVVIKVDEGKADFKVSEEIENLVIAGNKKLILPQIYYWVEEERKIKIIKLSPFTQSLEENTQAKEFVLPAPKKMQVKKTATKLLLDYSGEVLPDLNPDAVLLHLENPDVEKIAGQVNKILQFRDCTIIFHPNFVNSKEQNLEYAKSFLFFRNKKNLNCQIVLPETFSKDEFLNLKRDYAALGIYSKGGLKIWKQFSCVADFLNLQDYLDAGFDGASVDLDKIVEILTGIEAELFLSDPRKDWINPVEKFFKEFGYLKLIKNNKQVLVSGKTIACEELLNFFIKSGVWGIAGLPNTINALREHVSFLEKTLARTKRIG